MLKYLPSIEIIEQLNDKLTKLLPILSGMNTTNFSPETISTDNDYDYMLKLNNILTELNL
jgi:hypothetical protein